MCFAAQDSGLQALKFLESSGFRAFVVLPAPFPPAGLQEEGGG